MSKAVVNKKTILGVVGALALAGLLVFFLCYPWKSGDDPFTKTILIDEEHFPDEHFRDYVCQNFDRNENGSLDVSEYGTVSWIDVSDKEITSLKGIEYFTGLERLSCYGNELTELDLSQNRILGCLQCGGNSLTALDVSNNPELYELSCYGNELTELDVSHNPDLKTLQCSENQLTELDVSQNPLLDDLHCNVNKLTALDVSHNPRLTSLNCGENALKELDVSHNPRLDSLGCDGIELTTLDVSHNPRLKWLNCSENVLQELDLSHNPRMETLYCRSNEFTALDLSKNPELTYYLDCDENVAIVRAEENETIPRDFRVQIDETNFPDEAFRQYIAENITRKNYLDYEKL